MERYDPQKTLVRYFLDFDEVTFAQTEYIDTYPIIPYPKSEVNLDTIISEDRSDIDFDYFKVKRVCYSYGDTHPNQHHMIVDILVKGMYDIQDSEE